MCAGEDDGTVWPRKAREHIEGIGESNSIQKKGGPSA